MIYGNLQYFSQDFIEIVLVAFPFQVAF